MHINVNLSNEADLKDLQDFLYAKSQENKNFTINEQKGLEFVKIDKKIRRRVVKKPVCLEQRRQDQRVQNSAQQ